MIRRLLQLNGLAVICAVVHHATGWGFTSMFWWTDRYGGGAAPDFTELGTPAYYFLRVLEQSTTFSLPLFLFVSGFFVALAAGPDGRGFGWQAVRGRLRFLIVPYVLWSSTIFVWRAIEGRFDTPVGYLEQMAVGAVAPGYYFVPLLIQLYLLAPVIAPFVQRHWRAALAAAAVLQLTVQAARYPAMLGWESPVTATIVRLSPGWFFVGLVFWFFFGAYAAYNLSALKQRLSIWKPYLPWVATGLGVLALAEWEFLLQLSPAPWLNPMPTPLDALFSGAVILTLLTWAPFPATARRQMERLGENSFGVYLIHAPALEILARGAYIAIPLLLGQQVIFQSILLLAGIGLPLMLMTTVNRSPVRPYYRYLFG